MTQESIHIHVPATTANLGSGFDAVGLALDYHDTLSFTLGQEDSDAVQVDIEGEGADTLPRDASHLVVKSFRDAARDLGLPMRELHVLAKNRIPQARGMGSSAEAIVAGISAAYAFAHDGALDRDAVFAAAAKVEGHPDNVAPAVYGGLTFSWKLENALEESSSESRSDDPNDHPAVAVDQLRESTRIASGYHTVRYPVSSDIRSYVFVPDFALSTRDARNALPTQVPYQDAIVNVSRVGLLPAALCPSFYAGREAIQGSGLDRNQLLFCATQDALHQQYRSALMPESTSLLKTLREHGLAAAVSGAGPCVLVLHSGDITEELRSLSATQLQSGHWKLLPLAIDLAGVQVEQSL